MTDENEQQKYLEEFNKYFPESDRESGVIKEIRDDLEGIKKIDNLEAKTQAVRLALKKHQSNIGSATNCYFRSKAKNKGISEFDTLHIYKKLVKELSNLHFDLNLASMRKSRDQNNKTQCSNCQDTQNQLDQAKQEIQNLKEKLTELQPNNDIEPDHSNQIKSNQIKSNQIKSNQIKSNQIKSNQIKSNQIKVQRV